MLKGEAPGKVGGPPGDAFEQVYDKVRQATHYIACIELKMLSICGTPWYCLSFSPPSDLETFCVLQQRLRHTAYCIPRLCNAYHRMLSSGRAFPTLCQLLPNGCTANWVSDRAWLTLQHCLL